MSDTANPTTKSGAPPAEAPHHFRVQLDYNPVSGEFAISGNVHDPLLLHGMLGMAAAAFERNAARQAAAAITWPPGVGPIPIPRRS